MTTRPVLTYLSLVASTTVDGEQGWRAEAACQYTDPEARWAPTSLTFARLKGGHQTERKIHPEVPRFLKSA